MSAKGITPKHLAEIRLAKKRHDEVKRAHPTNSMLMGETQQLNEPEEASLEARCEEWTKRFESMSRDKQLLENEMEPGKALVANQEEKNQVEITENNSEQITSEVDRQLKLFIADEKIKGLEKAKKELEERMVNLKMKLKVFKKHVKKLSNENKTLKKDVDSLKRMEDNLYEWWLEARMEVREMKKKMGEKDGELRITEDENTSEVPEIEYLGTHPRQENQKNNGETATVNFSLLGENGAMMMNELMDDVSTVVDGDIDYQVADIDSDFVSDMN